MSEKLTEAGRRIEHVRLNRGSKLDLFGLGLTELPITIGELGELQGAGLGVTT